MIRKVFLMLLFCSSMFADFSEENIANSLKEIGKMQQIDSKLLYSIAKIESNFDPLVIAFTSKKKDFNFTNAKTIIMPYKNKNLIQVRADENTLKLIAKELINKGYKVDVGLMQINSVNFSSEELPYIFKPKYNIYKSAQVLKGCNAKFQSLKEILECYNKGFGEKSSYDYYLKVKNSFISSFGGVR